MPDRRPTRLIGDGYASTETDRPNRRDPPDTLKGPEKEQQICMLQTHKKYLVFQGNDFNFYFNLMIKISSKYILKYVLRISKGLEFCNFIQTFLTFQRRI